MSYETKQPPSYPVTCHKCGVKYGPTSRIKNHRPGSMACVSRRDKLRKLCPECGEARTCRACKQDYD